MKIRRVFLIFLSVILVAKAQSQDWSQIKINEYFWNAPLSKVFTDLKSHYNLNIQYDPVLSSILFSQNFSQTTVRQTFNSICENLDSVYWTTSDSGKIFFGIKKKEISTREACNSPYLGKPTRFNITITGIIKDVFSGESLPYASIVVRGKYIGTTTNVDGYFTLEKVPSDTVALLISYVGYCSTVFYLNPEAVRNYIIIELKKQMQNLQAVEIVAKQDQMVEANSGISKIRISPKQMEVLPNLGERDVFRSLQLLPGVMGSNESSSGLYVRGGTPDQNLVIFDGFTVYHQEHLYGMFSAFNPNSIKDVQLFKGGFESKYGGKLSSVVEITGKTGNENEFNAGGEVSFLSFNVFTEIPLNKKGSILIAGRKSFQTFLYKQLFNAFDNSGKSTQTAPIPNRPGGGFGKASFQTEPESYFYDLNTKITYNLTKKDIISLSFFNGQDDLDNSQDISRSFGNVSVEGGNTDFTKWGNWGSSLKWSRKASSVFYTNNLISVSNYYSTREKLMTRKAFQNSSETDTKQGMYENNDLTDLSFKSDNEFKLNSWNQLEFGTHLTNLKINYIYTQNDTTTVLKSDEQGFLSAFYFQDRISPNTRLKILPGIRWTYFTNTGKAYTEPRLQADYKLTKNITLKAATGKYFQFANRVVREDVMSGSRDFWVLSNKTNIPVCEAIHYITGLSYVKKGYLFDIEAYYKDLKGLTEYTLRYSPSFGNQKISFDSLFYNGSGFSRGVEFLIQKQTGVFTGWIGYTLGQVLYNFPNYGDGYYPAYQDVTHEVKLVGTYKWKKWDFSASWIYATGKPYTEIIGGYTIKGTNGEDLDYIIAGTKNNARYPDYHRLDVSALWNYKWGNKANGTIGFSLINAYNRKNVWYKEYEIDETGLSETTVTLLGITPNLSISFN